jgi:acetylornithine deacetylase
VRIHPVTGDADAGIRRIADWLNESGAEVDYWYDGIGELLADPAYPGHEVQRAWVPVVAGVIRGTRPGPTVLLTGHVDVVPPGDYAQWTMEPYSGITRDDRVYGRGAADMKSGLISAMEAFEAFAQGPRDFAGRVVFIAVPAEEDSGLGTLAAIRAGWKADACIVPEPTSHGGETRIITAHAGAMSCEIDIPGMAAHASKRLTGESALDHYLHLHQALRRAEQALNEQETHPLMKALGLPYATNIGTIHGGTWSSSVMDKLTVEVRIGVALNETVQEAKARFERDLETAVQDNAWLRNNPPIVRWKAAGFGSAQTPTEHPLVTALSEANQEVFGSPATTCGAPYGCDMSAWVRLTRTPTVLYGPGEIEQAHATDEWASLSQTVSVARVLVEATERLLSMPVERLRAPAA